MGVQPFTQRFFELVWQQLKQNGPPFGGGCKDLLFSGHFVRISPFLRVLLFWFRWSDGIALFKKK